MLQLLKLRIPGLSRPIVYAGLALATILLGGIVAQHYWPDLRWIAAPENLGKPSPRLAIKTRLIEKAVPKIVERQVVVYEPAPKDEKKLEEKYDLKLKEAGAKILTEVDIGKLENGGSALATINEKGETEIKIAPKRAPFFKLGGPFELGGGVVYSSDKGQGFTVHAGKDLFRLWRITTKVEANLDIYGGQTQGRAALLGVVRF